jgi:hypothetical protein
MPKIKLAIMTIPAALLLMSQSVFAETHVVTAVGMKYEPLVVKVAPVDGLIPEGAEKINSPMSENYQYTFDKEGIYIYKCTPHIGAGMGGAIIVGEPTNLDAIKSADAKGGVGRVVKKAVPEAESM